MIRIGLTVQEKVDAVARYRADHAIDRCFVLSPERLRIDVPDSEAIEWAEIIEYRFFYRLLQEIGPRTLVVVNECLRTQNRHDLTYNCIRHFLNQTDHPLVFQHLPLIDAFDDFMILLDFATRSRFKRRGFEPSLLAGVDLRVAPVPVRFDPIAVETPPALHESYRREKDRLFAGIGARDPHTIPRNLHLVGGKAKLARVEPGRRYVGRNARFRLANLGTYRQPRYPDAPYTVFEFCHNFIDFADLVSLSGQAAFDVLTTDLKVDAWYLGRYQQWARRIADAYATLHG